jgi:hypothetical protein
MLLLDELSHIFQTNRQLFPSRNLENIVVCGRLYIFHLLHIPSSIVKCVKSDLHYHDI